jgi:hypothetical protein
MNMVQLTSGITAVLPKQCIKMFVKCVSGRLTLGVTRYCGDPVFVGDGGVGWVMTS